MGIPIRKIFATLLVTVALVPVLLVVLFYTSNPQNVVELASRSRGPLWTTLWVLIAGAGLALLYPPSVPLLRLQFVKNWRRLGTDRGPLYDGLARIRNFETHADRLAVGRLARQLGDVKLAEENLSRAHEMEPSHVAGRYQLALFYGETGRPQQAAELLDSVVRDDAKHAFGDALLHLGRNRFRLGESDAALEALQHHQRLFPGNREVHLLMARLLASRGDLATARTERAAAARPAGEKEHMSPAEQLARAQAKVTILKPGSAS